MAGQGLQNIPLRIPEKWDAAWYLEHLREVLALADTRNAIEGSGIVITGQSGEVATISTSEDLQNLLLQSYVLATPSGFLNFERILAGEPGVIDIADGGPNANITVSIQDRGINLGKLVELSGLGVLGNPVDDIGAIQNIPSDGDKSVLHATATTVDFSTIDHTYVSDFDEAAQDAVGTILVDSTSIDFTYNDGANTITASIIDEYVQDLVGALLVDSSSIDFTYNDGAGTLTAATINADPSGLIGMSAVNGTASTPLRSDGRHAINPAIAPTWTGNHTFAPSSGNTVFSAGNVAVSNTLTASSFGLADGSALSPALFFVNDPSTGILLQTTGELRWVTANVTRLVVNSAGIQVRNSIGVANGSAGSPSLSFENDTDNGGYLIGTNNWGLSAGGGLVMDFVAARATMNVPLRRKGYTVAGLPTGVVGDSAYVTDALAPVFLGVVAGGGAVITPVFHNGTNWIAE